MIMKYYQCQRCTNCCKWPGDVIVTPPEIAAIAGHLQLEEQAFIEGYTRLSANRRFLSLIEKDNGECFFLEGKNCSLQQVKPSQCSGFPNQWNFPGWREVCEAVEVDSG